MLLNIIKNIRLESITSEEISSVSQPNFSLTVNWGAYTNAGSNNTIENLLRGIRIRCFVATTTDSASSLDFITQRFNEYLLAQETATDEMSVSDKMFTSYIRGSLSDNERQYLSPSSPVSPFSVNSEVVTNLFRNPQTSLGAGEMIPTGIIMYDQPLLDQAARDDNGNVLITTTGGNTSVPLAQPAAPTTAQSVLESIPASMRKTLNGSLINQILNASSGTSSADKIYLTPVTIPLIGQSIEDASQLSLYAYAYVPATQGGAQTALGVPLTPISAINIKGTQSLWLPATADRLLVRKRPAGPGVIYAPDNGLLHILNNQTANTVAEKITTGWSSFFSQPQNIITETNPNFADLLQDDTPYSKLWATVDHDKSVRFSFAVDQAQFLQSRSILPYFYSNASMANKMLSASPIDINTGQSTPHSSIRSIKVKRHICDRTATMPGNNLSTSAHLSPLKPDSLYSEEYISNPQEIERIVGFNSQSKIKFYEGIDHLVAEQTRNSISYSVDIEAYDAAPEHLRQIVKKLFSFQSTLNRVYSHLIDIHSKTSGGAILLTPLENYTIGFNNIDERYDSFIIKLLREYAEILNETLPGKPVEMEKYIGLVKGLSGAMPIKWLTEIQHMLDLGVNFYFNKLKSIFPDDPLGDNSNNKMMALESVGLKQTLYPIVHGQHKFSEILNPASQVKYGQDFVFSNQQQEEKKILTGLLRITLPEMLDRFSLEFNKYFQPVGNEQPLPLVFNQAVPDIVNAIPTNMSYLSPRTIQMPSKKPFDQTTAFQKRGASYIYYDLDKYGDLFVELVRTRIAISQIYYGTPIGTQGLSSADSDCGTSTSLNAESLYTSILTDLGQTHTTLIGDYLTPQYSPPKIISGEYEPTEGLTSTIPYLPGQLAIPSIIGGLGDTAATTEAYVSSVDTTLANPTENTEDLNKLDSSRQEFKRPIKLPFAIFGELAVDSKINLDVSYQDKDFNSMRGLVNAFGVNNLNVRQMIENKFSGLPFQLKSMMVVAASSDGALLFPTSPQGPYNACRPMLDDINPSDNLNQMVSFWESGLDQPAYATTIDPMKMYSKFMAFWLNYKELGTVECLNQFGTATEDFGSNVAIDQWVPFSAGVLNQLASNERLLCRVSPVTKAHYEKMLPAGDSCEAYLQTSYGEAADVLSLPIYNQYFIIENSAAPPEETQLQETSNVVYSLNQTKY
jgi:hypothetical protein